MYVKTGCHCLLCIQRSWCLTNIQMNEIYTRSKQPTSIKCPKRLVSKTSCKPSGVTLSPWIIRPSAVVSIWIALLKSGQEIAAHSAEERAIPLQRNHQQKLLPCSLLWIIFVGGENYLVRKYFFACGFCQSLLTTLIWKIPKQWFLKL